MPTWTACAARVHVDRKTGRIRSVFAHPVVIEGYADTGAPADALASSYARAQIVRNYLEARYPFAASKVGVIPLSATPPPGA